MKRAGIVTLLRMLMRSLFIQGSFSAKYRQHLGFAYTVDPLGRKLYPDPDEYRAFVIRHTENYNGNPFMIPLVLGAVAHMEERLSGGGETTAEDIAQFKKIIGPATGAIGDRLFWSNLRPFTLLCGITGTLLFGLWGTVLFLGAFNLPVSVLKLRWFLVGYRLGPNVVGELRHDLIQQVERFLEIAGCVLAGINGVALYTIIGGHELSEASYLGMAVLFVGTVAVLKRGVPLYTAVTWAGLIAAVCSLAAVLA